MKDNKPRWTQIYKEDCLIRFCTKYYTYSVVIVIDPKTYIYIDHNSYLKCLNLV